MPARPDRRPVQAERTLRCWFGSQRMWLCWGSQRFSARLPLHLWLPPILLVAGFTVIIAIPWRTAALLSIIAIQWEAAAPIVLCDSIALGNRQRPSSRPGSQNGGGRAQL